MQSPLPELRGVIILSFWKMEILSKKRDKIGQSINKINDNKNNNNNIYNQGNPNDKNIRNIDNKANIMNDTFKSQEKIEKTVIKRKIKSIKKRRILLIKMKIKKKKLYN